MNELETYIHGYFGIDLDDVSEVTKLFELRAYEKGDSFLEVGSRHNGLGFVRSGCFRIYGYSKKEEITQWISSPGEFVAELSSLVFDQPSRFGIQALAPSEVYYMSHENYSRLGQVVPAWNHLEKLFLSKCFMTLEERVFSFLSCSAEERYRLLQEKKPDVFQLAPQRFIASMLGMTPETFSRIRKNSIS